MEGLEFFKGITHNKDFWPMCWDEKFLHEDIIDKKCLCDDAIKAHCFALYDLFKSKSPDKDEKILFYISNALKWIAEEWGI